MTTKVKIENDYEDRSHSERVVEIDSEPASHDDDVIIDWFEEHVWPQTGDGTGANMSACYTATIVGGPFDGEWKEWV